MLTNEKTNNDNNNNNNTNSKIAERRWSLLLQLRLFPSLDLDTNRTRT